jgi:hypothetical protein
VDFSICLISTVRDDVRDGQQTIRPIQLGNASVCTCRQTLAAVSGSMGIPALFRWLSRKYPCIVEPCHEEKPKEVCGIQIPVDTSQPNPNNVEFDNLYLDMNGIIHPCCNPDNKSVTSRIVDYHICSSKLAYFKPTLIFTR